MHYNLSYLHISKQLCKLFTKLFLALCLTSPFIAKGQNYTQIDNKVKSYPSSFSSAETLSKKIKKDFSTPTAQIRTAYTWLTLNIRYDLKEYKKGKKQYRFSYKTQEELARKIEEKNNAIVKKTIQSKKAVCEGYSATFKKICDLLNIECIVIHGHSKTHASEIGNNQLEGAHAWNAVKINKHWRLIDTTWGAGFSNGSNNWVSQFNDYFFFTPPNELIYSHFPEKEKWQLLKNTISETEFDKLPIHSPLYFESGVEINSPKEGVLNGSKKENLSFSIQNIPQDKTLYYAYLGDKYIQKPILENGIFKIPFRKKNILTILLDTKMVAQFKTK